jgi:hypothetical protein
VLGPLEADVDGAPADLGGPRQRCVLARLIAERGRVVSANRLIEDLCADKAPPKALAAAGDTAAARAASAEAATLRTTSDAEAHASPQD